MGSKERMHYQMAGRKGVKIINLGPLGPGLSEKEWIKWLNYIPQFQQERIEYLKNKKVKDLTPGEKRELYRLQKELRMAAVSKIYGKQEMDKADALEYINYATQETLESLICRKLTGEEYESAIEKANQIKKLSYEDMLSYCKKMEAEYGNLSMADSLTLREVEKEINVISLKKTGEKIKQALDENERMRKKSLIEAANRIVF